MPVARFRVFGDVRSVPDPSGSGHVLSILATEFADGAGLVRPDMPIGSPVRRDGRVLPGGSAWVVGTGLQAAARAGQPDAGRRIGSDTNRFATRSHALLVRTQSAGRGGGVAL